jgi:endonuclease G
MRNFLLLLLILALLIGVIYFLHNSEKQSNSKEKKQTETVPGNLNDFSPKSNSANERISVDSHPEWPTVADEKDVVSHTGFSLFYDEKHEQARWVAYELTRAETVKSVERSNRFMNDPAIRTESASDEDYAKSGYDRGHLAPAADMSWSTTTMEESFYYSNMSPQNPGFNRGIWKKLETQVRNWASEHTSIYIVTGPVLSEGLTTIGPNKVSVPRYYYKVILDNEEPGRRGIGFILPNEPSKQSLSAFAVTIDSVEKCTGLDFFPELLKGAHELESEICFDCW